MGQSPRDLDGGARKLGGMPLPYASLLDRLGDLSSLGLGGLAFAVLLVLIKGLERV